MSVDPKLWSALPIVDLCQPELPANGALVSLPRTCRQKFATSSRCKSHYEGLRGKPRGLYQCPFGFSSFVFSTISNDFAFSGVVPSPRQGGRSENRNSKDFPENRIALGAMEKFADGFSQIETSRKFALLERLEKVSSTLHELRKYNRTVKQEAERLCLEKSPDDPEAADAKLVRIWKSAELITQQFDIIELLGNEKIFTLQLNSVVEPYKIFDKTLRIYRVIASEKKVVTKIRNAHGNFVSRVHDKTFPIISTALIENAIKYAIPDTEVRVTFVSVSSGVRVTVSNVGKRPGGNMNRIFERGVRNDSSVEGDGVGLFLAQQVAIQHKTKICVEVKDYSIDNRVFDFHVDLPVHGKPRLT